jgi:hypothetical protein
MDSGVIALLLTVEHLGCIELEAAVVDEDGVLFV